MLTHVTRPIKIGAVEIKNRVVRTAHGTGLYADGLGGELIAYHLARARGGVGLTFIEILGVHRTTVAGLNVYDPRMPAGYAKLVEVVRPTGMRLFQQLWHGGQNSLPRDGSPPWGPSDLPSPEGGVPTVPMTKGMIDEIVEAFAKTAAACVEWGMDGVEIHGAHGYLPAQFLSANTNKREDDYGGPLENRARFLLEIARAVRASTPKGYPVGVRLAPDYTAGGVGPEESLIVAKMLEAEGLIDFVDVSAGNYQSFPKMVGGMHEPMGYEMPTSAPVTAGVAVPTIVTGRFRTLEEADQVIRAGEADLVALTRAHIADPDIVAKTLAGHPEQVRPCIACNQGCVGNLRSAKRRVGCVINPGGGWEETTGDDKLVPAARPLKVLVVGGGPAGLEAARVAALRGHKVTLAEAQGRLGGTLILAARAPTRHGMLDFVSWIEGELRRLDVEIRLGTYLDAEDVLAMAPDAVILATGASPRMDGIQASNPGEPVAGMDRPHVISSHDLFAEPKRRWGAAAVVVDDVGHYEGIAAADHLVSQGTAVTYVSRHISFGPGVESALMNEPALERMSRGDLAVRLRSRAIAVEDDAVVIGPTYLPATTNQVERAPANVVVFISANRSNRELHAALADKGLTMHVVGDANTPRSLESAVHEGHRAAVSLN